MATQHRRTPRSSRAARSPWDSASKTSGRRRASSGSTTAAASTIKPSVNWMCTFAQAQNRGISHSSRRGRAVRPASRRRFISITKKSKENSQGRGVARPRMPAVAASVSTALTSRFCCMRRIKKSKASTIASVRAPHRRPIPSAPGCGESLPGRVGPPSYSPPTACPAPWKGIRRVPGRAPCLHGRLAGRGWRRELRAWRRSRRRRRLAAGSGPGYENVSNRGTVACSAIQPAVRRCHQTSGSPTPLPPIRNRTEKTGKKSNRNYHHRQCIAEDIHGSTH